MNQDELKQKYEAGEKKVDSFLVRLVDSKYTLSIVIMVAVVVLYLAFR